MALAVCLPPTPPHPPCKINNALARATAGVLSAIFGTMSCFVFMNTTPCQSTLFPSNFGSLVLLLVGRLLLAGGGGGVNSLPFNFSWACLLLSISAWMQLAHLCDHATPTVLRAMKGAIHRVCSRGPWCVDATISWAVLQARNLPTSPKCSAHLLQNWLEREAFWYEGNYVSWHAPHSGECSATCAPWDSDFDVLADI